MADENTCPSCGTPSQGASGEPESCAECGQWWVPSTDAATRRMGPHELEIQNAPGDAVRGPFDRLDLRERLYKGLLTGDELVRPAGGRFRALRSIPDFAAVLELRERGKPKPVLSRRVAPEPPKPKVEAEAPESGVAPAALADLEVPDKSRVTTLVILTGGIGLVLVVAAYIAFSMLV